MLQLGTTSYHHYNKHNHSMWLNQHLTTKLNMQYCFTLFLYFLPTVCAQAVPRLRQKNYIKRIVSIGCLITITLQSAIFNQCIAVLEEIKQFILIQNKKWALIFWWDWTYWWQESTICDQWKCVPARGRKIYTHSEGPSISSFIRSL